MKALSGIRVVDFSWAAAVPFGTFLLALMGAEVIKIESRKRPDILRGVEVLLGWGKPDLDSSPIFFSLSLNKKSLSIDITHPKAKKVIFDLIKISDVVVENFSPGVMKRLGFSYEEIRKVKPDIIMLSSSFGGQEGPEAKFLGYAPIFGAMGGVSYLTGYPDERPSDIRAPSDLISAASAMFALMSALYHRERTGEGQYIDVSSREVLSSLVGDSILDYILNGRVQERCENRDDVMAPHNLYPCKGRDRWISIAIKDDEEWESLLEAMGNPEWGREERFSDPYLRWENQDELDKLISAWTINHDAFELTRMLQERGIAAFPSMSNRDLFEDPHLRERGHIIKVKPKKIREFECFFAPWRFSSTPPVVETPGPLLGEHNYYVLKELLGYSDEEVRELEEEGVLE